MGRLIVQRACADQQYREIHDIQVEYEESLPADLRHGLAVLTALERLYREPNAAFLASLDGATAGCVGVAILDRSADVLQRLYVKPAYRHRGVARALIDAAIAFSRERGRARIVLDTERTRLRAAYELYLSLGFTECQAYGPVDYATPTFMELRLR